MGIGSIGSTSFWQQDQSYWQNAQSDSNTIASTDSIINAMSSAETNQGKGLASIANKTALDRTNSQLTAAIENLLNGTTGSSSSSSTGASSSSSRTAAAPATATGTASLSTSTPLSLLGVLAGGTITVGVGPNTTSYTSTGTDTVGDLMNAINANDYGNAAVTASLNTHGNLVITAKNDTTSIFIGGLYASNIGFGVGHQAFTPTKGSSSSPSSTSNSPTASSTKSTSSSTAKTNQSYATAASETSSSAASLLSDSGVGGNLVDMLA
jgi:hypothetical protein